MIVIKTSVTMTAYPAPSSLYIHMLNKRVPSNYLLAVSLTCDHNYDHLPRYHYIAESKNKFLFPTN